MSLAYQASGYGWKDLERVEIGHIERQHAEGVGPLESHEDVITHCYPLERISATALVLLAMDSAPRDEDRAIHLQSVDSYLDKSWAVFSQTGACIKYKAEANRPPPP
ncbi:hypothetical protein Bbelb_219970 [Branchiostoma belcheri]|nr:hypothetical protein Bbelb_219970 [Branchiostoma belcheri]